ncbi:hypothetical protein KX067_004651 [Escherichia coli]|nr:MULTISPECIES: hypothetical protein [Enterobacteriaceae]EFO2220997.1 hypothetical protein [Escherichia coli O11]EKM4388966.1 hypothetical protein [Shigella sonnei]ATX14381.1 hypothetical protein CU077_10025 [Escherichia coli]AWT01024.1 hypothetical protein BEN53_07985 [Escherichia coli]AZR89581.1 hypothetical protein DWB25_14925 [Escherichia coli]
MGWHQMKIRSVSKVEKVEAEFVIWMFGVIPSAKVKIKIRESQDGSYMGITNVMIKRKFDDCPEGAIGWGKTVDEALENTINNFLAILDSDYPRELYPDGLSDEHIEYMDHSDF